MPDKPEDKPTENTFNDPDLENSEQNNEEGTQAQDVAGDALEPAEDDDVLESEPGSPANPADLVPRDVPDLVDNLNNMIRSGQIDMGAFEGKESMDDEEE